MDHAKVSIELPSPENPEETYILERSVPQQFHQLNEEQFRALANLYFARFHFDEYQFQFLRSLLGMNQKEYLQLTPEQVKDLLLLLKPFLKEPNSRISLLPEVKLKTQTFISPGNQFLNFILDEFVICDILYHQALKTRRPDIINAFCAVCYKPKGKSFAHYEKEKENWEKNMLKVDSETKYAMLLNYMCTRNFISDKFRYVFNGKGGSAVKADNGWRKTVVSLAGPKFGDPQSVRRSELHDILVHIDDEQKAASKRKK